MKENVLTPRRITHAAPSRLTWESTENSKLSKNASRKSSENSMTFIYTWESLIVSSSDKSF